MTVVYRAKYLIFSLSLHIIILLIFIIGFDLVTPLPVIENSNQHDIISATVLGDTEKSKIVSQLSEVKPIIQQTIKEQKIETPKSDTQPKKEKLSKKINLKKQRQLFAQDLLVDLKKYSKKHSKQLEQKQNKIHQQFQ